MENMLQPILAELDPKVVYIVVAMFALLVVLAIVKKALKIAIVVAVFGSCIFLLAPAAKEFQSNFKINTEQGAIHLLSEGQEYTIDNFANIKKATLIYNGKQQIEVDIEYNESFLNFTVPAFMGEQIKEFFDSHDVKYKIQ